MEENVFTFAFDSTWTNSSKTKIVCSCMLSAENVVEDDISQLGYLYSKRRSVEIKETRLNG